MAHGEISDLARIFRSNGDKLLDATCKLSLSSTLIRKLNVSLSHFCKQKGEDVNFQLAPCSGDNNKGIWDLQLLYDFIQKIVALKILPGISISKDISVIDLQLFHSLRLLEINRFSLNLVKGLKYLRSHLEYLTCIRSFSNLSDVLEYCGADKCQGYVWMQLKKAVFSHNDLSTLDGSLEFIPKLEILDLSHNNLTDAYMVNCLPCLYKLNLSYNRLQCVPYFTGSLCNNLQNLCLHNNFIEDVNDLAALVNLRKLDLSNNCLLNHCILAPLSCLPNLEWLNLLGNPLSFHPCHRVLTVHYLHPQITSNFILDYVKLSTTEKRVVNSIHFVPPSISRSVSFNSQITDATVINKNNDFECTSEGSLSNLQEARDFISSINLETSTFFDKTCLDSMNANVPFKIIDNVSITKDSQNKSVATNNSVDTNSNANNVSKLNFTSSTICTAHNADHLELGDNVKKKVADLHSSDISKHTIYTDNRCLSGKINKDEDDVENSNTNVDTLEPESTNTFTDENIHMQDSGFFAATRPISPSQSSIGSANSLLSNEICEPVEHYESDIEVLTNPSQSSIEVLDNSDHDSWDIRFTSS